MHRLLIIGASGHGKVIADMALRLRNWESIAFLDNNEHIVDVMGIPVIGRTADAVRYLADADMVVGIGDNALRKKVQEELEAAGASFPSLIHPHSTIAHKVDIGPGTVVMAGAVINCCTRIGKGCIINTGATVDHDNDIAAFVHVSPGAHLAGAVSVGPGTWLGIGCTVSNNICIAGGCIIGAGAVVVRDIVESGIYIGVPARKR